MSDNLSNINSREDEIDLLDLFRRIGRTIKGWARALGKAIIISLVFIFKSWLPLGLSIAAGIGTSYLLSTTSVSFFTSDLVFRNNLAVMDLLKIRDITGTTSEIISKINKLHIFGVQSNSKAMAEALSLDLSASKNIYDIGAFWIIDNSKDGIPDYVDYKGDHSPYDTLNIRMQDRFNIRVKIKSPDDLGMIRDGIIKYIGNDSLYQQRNRVRLRQTMELIARLDLDIKDLDSLQKIKYFQETKNRQAQGSGPMIFLQEQKTQLVYNDAYTLYTRKQNLEEDRDLYKSIVTVLSDFTLAAQRDNGTIFYAKKIVPLVFGFMLIILIIIANMKKIKELYSKY